MLRVSVRTLWRMSAADELPAPVRIGARRVRWRQADILNFIDGLQES